MTDELREALDEYVRACDGDPQTEATETMERRIARLAVEDAIEGVIAMQQLEKGFF